MSIISEYQLTHCSMKLLAYLFYYRGMTALQLSQMYYESEKAFPTQKSSVHNYLSKLKKQNLVASKKPEDSVRPGSIYYLTPKGFEVVKEMLNIDVGATENGFILLNEKNGIPTQSDLPYSLYQPPKQQIQHHLLLIDFFIRLRIHFLKKNLSITGFPCIAQPPIRTTIRMAKSDQTRKSYCQTGTPIGSKWIDQRKATPNCSRNFKTTKTSYPIWRKTTCPFHLRESSFLPMRSNNYTG